MGVVRRFFVLAAATFSAVVLMGCGETCTLTTTVVPAEAGTVLRKPNKTSFAPGKKVAVVATPAAGYRFFNWTVTNGQAQIANADSVVATIILNPNPNTTVTANFRRLYTLTINRNSEIGGNITTESGLRHDAETPIAITAIADTGHRFVNWTITDGQAWFANSNSARTTITLMSNATITANFNQMVEVVEDPRASVTQMGALGIVSGQIKGESVASKDIFGKGGFASDIDAILSGVGGLKSGGDSGVGRKGVAGIGYGSGYGSGFGGSGGGIDMLSGLMGGGGGGLDLKERGGLRVSSPDFLKGGALTGGRSRASIQRVVMQNMAALRHAYSRRLKDKPDLSGTVTVKFSIDEFGRVISAQMTGSTINDSELENTVVSRVKSWVFDKIDKPGDVTEVTYPFTFSQ